MVEERHDLLPTLLARNIDRAFSVSGSYGLVGAILQEMRNRFGIAVAARKK